MSDLKTRLKHLADFQISDLSVAEEAIEEIESLEQKLAASEAKVREPEDANGCDHDYHFFGEYKVRRCNKCSNLEINPPQEDA